MKAIKFGKNINETEPTSKQPVQYNKSNNNKNKKAKNVNDRRIIKKESRKWEKLFGKRHDMYYNERIQASFDRLKAFYYNKESYNRLVKKKKLYYDVLLQRCARLKNEEQVFASFQD